MQQELEVRRQALVTKERSLADAEAAAEKRWAKLTEDVSAKVTHPLRASSDQFTHASVITLYRCPELLLRTVYLRAGLHNT